MDKLFDLQCIWTKVFDADPHLLQCGNVTLDPFGVACRQSERLRKEQFLGRNPLLFHTPAESAG
jgi:hypothetical protein